MSIGRTIQDMWFAFLVLVITGIGAQHCNAQTVAGKGDPETCWSFLEAKNIISCTRCIADLEHGAGKSIRGDGEQAQLFALKGALTYANGNAAKGEEQLLIALPKYLAAGSPWLLGTRINRTLGHIAYEQGDYHKALERYDELLSIELLHRAHGSLEVARAQYNIGNCYWGMDQRDSCKAHYSAALAIWEAGDPSKVPVVGYVHEVLGTYAWEEGNERLALEHFNIAAARQLKNASGVDEADRMAEAASTKALNGQQDEALRLYEQALEFREKNYGAANPNTACMHNDIAQMLLAMGRPEEAMTRVQQAIGLYLSDFKPTDKWSNPASVNGATSYRLLLDALLLKFRLLKADAKDEHAARATDEVIDLALQTIERLRTGASSEGSKLFWTTQVRGFFEEAIGHCEQRFNTNSDRREIERALTIMEMSKNALLAESMRSLDALSIGGLPKELATEERTLKSRIADMRRYITLEEKKCDRMDADKVGLWKKTLTAAEADLDQLVMRMSTEFPAYHELKYGSSAIKLDEVLKRLGPHRSLLCMFQGEAADYFIQFDARCARFTRNDSVAAITKTLQEIRGSLTDRERSLADPQRSYAEFTSAASFLYEVAFGGSAQPFEDLVIMPDGLFQYLPFEVLLTAPPPSTRNYKSLHYLIKDHAVQYIPMMRTWLHERTSDARTEGYVGMAPRYDEHAANGLSPLRFNEQEVDAVRSLLGGDAFIGTAATEANFKLHASNAEIVHLAMHTVIDDEDPLRTAFAFGAADSSQDGLLDMSELFGMEMKARLAVLSACRTGDGKMLHGEGIMSMARAFTHAGCPSILMSHWNCEDAATRSIITEFFSTARKGEGLDRSLRLAKLHYLETCDPLKAHPYYWSTMVLLGDERAIDLRLPWYRRAWLWILGGCLVAIAIARLRFAKRT